MKVERVSYDVITPSAARAIFEAIFWKPAIRWNVKKIEVLNQIKWISVRRNEIGALMSVNSKGLFIEDKGKREQKTGFFLKDVRYRIHAELEYIPVDKRPQVQNPVPEYLMDMDEKNLIEECEKNIRAGKDENPGKYNAIFERRAKKGQCFHRPYLGCREFACMFRFIEDIQKEELKPIDETRYLGFMLYDLDYSAPSDPKPLFFRVEMKNGIIFVPDRNSEEVHK